MHFRNYPSTSLFRDQSIETTRDFFMSMVKEASIIFYTVLRRHCIVLIYTYIQADFLRHGSTKKVMNLSKSDQTQLWDSLCSSKYSA